MSNYRRTAFLSIGLLVVGVSMIAAGFGWALATGAVLPSPDATPAQAAAESRNNGIAAAVMLVGALLSAVGCTGIAAALLQWLLHARRRPAGFPVVRRSPAATGEPDR